MRDDIIRKNVIILVSALLVFFALSLIVWSNYSRQSKEKDLISFTNIINNQIKAAKSEEEINTIINKFSDDQDWLRIVVANSNGDIIIDSSTDTVSAISRLSKQDLELAESNQSEEKRVYFDNNHLHYVSKIDNDIIVRSSVTLASTKTLIAESLFLIVLIALIVVLISINTTRKTAERITLAFDNISHHLRTINEGKYEEIEINHHYQEVENSLLEINEINTNIYHQMITIKSEKDKLQFIINNIDQGLLIVDGYGKVISINNLARKFGNIEDNEIDFDYHKLTYAPLVLEKIADSILHQNNNYFDFDRPELNAIYYCSINYFKNTWVDFSQSDSVYIVKISDVTEERIHDKEKSEFISNASHELRTPITSISGFSEFLLQNDEGLSEQSKEFLTIINQESFKMKDTIEQLLLLSNIENRVDKFDFNEHIDFETLLNEVIEVQKEAINKFEITINKEIDEVDLYSNSALVKHIIRNLIENAVKYNRQNGIINFKVYEKDNLIYLIVSDTGIGIEEKYYDKIFDRFYRVDESHNSNTKGTGLGLNLVKQICTIINAQIHVESKLNVGSTFIVEFNKGNKEI